MKPAVRVAQRHIPRVGLYADGQIRFISSSIPRRNDDFSMKTADAKPLRVIPLRIGGRQSVSGIIATVFGATGFMGRYVVSDLGRIGSQVIVPFRSTDGMNARHLKLAGDLGQIVPMPFDLTKTETIERAVARSNVVINLIGNETETKNFSYHDTHVKISHRIAKIAKECGVDRFVHVSSMNARKDSPSAWLRSKAESEDVVRGFYPEATIIRPNWVYGHEDRFINRFANLLNLAPFVPLVNGGNTLVQPVFVQDVSAAIMAAITREECLGKTYDLSGPEPMSINQVVETVADNIYRPLTTVEIPVPVAKYIGGAFAKLAPYRARVWTEDFVEQLLEDRVQEPGQLTLQDLNISATPFMPTVLSLLVRHCGNRGPQARTILTTSAPTRQNYD